MIGLDSVGDVAVITLQRQPARNAIDGAMTAALEAALDRVEADAGGRVVVFGADGPVFCAGADLKALARGSVPAAAAATRQARRRAAAHR